MGNKITIEGGQHTQLKFQGALESRAEPLVQRRDWLVGGKHRLHHRLVWELDPDRGLRVPGTFLPLFLIAHGLCLQEIVLLPSRKKKARSCIFLHLSHEDGKPNLVLLAGHLQAY